MEVGELVVINCNCESLSVLVMEMSPVRWNSRLEMMMAPPFPGMSIRGCG